VLWRGREAATTRPGTTFIEVWRTQRDPALITASESSEPTLHPRSLGPTERTAMVVTIDQRGQSKMAEDPLLLRHVGFEPMLVAEDELRALALVDERIEGGKDVDAVLPGREALLQSLSAT